MIFEISTSYFSKIVFYGLLILSLAASTESQQIPSTFGLITVTHTRAGDNTQFMNYLKRYATMDCPIINEISIIWNNQKSMQQLGVFANLQNWKIPIYFIRTPSNAMDWRYLIPKQATSQVFFSIDDDINVGCQELTRGFDIWRKNAIGNIGPIVTYGARFYQFTLRGGFQYARMKEKDYFNLGLINLCFLSRHFLEMYYADIYELNQMRRQILKKNNCDDIAMNWLVQYFYPELQTIVIQGDIQNISPAVAQSTSSTHYPYRSECIRDFTNIFGVNPLRYAPIKDAEPYRQLRVSPLKKEVVLAKQKYLHQKYVKSSSFKPEDLTAILKADPNHKPATSAIIPSFDIIPSAQPILAQVPASSPASSFIPEVPIDPASTATVAGPMLPSATTTPAETKTGTPDKARLAADTARLQMQNKMLKIQIQQLNKRQYPNNDLELKVLRKRLVDDQQTVGQLSYRLYQRSYLEFGLVMLVLFLAWRLYDVTKDRNKKSKSIKLESNEIEAQNLG